MTNIYVIGNFSDQITCRKGFILTSEGKLYHNGTYVKTSKEQQYLFFSNEGQLVISVDREKITSKKKGNFVVVGFKILIHNKGKWEAYQYNEQYSRTYLIKTNTSSFIVPQLADVDVIAVNKLVSDVNINLETKQLSFERLGQQTGTLVVYYSPKGKTYRAIKATVLAILIEPIPGLGRKPTFFDGVRNKQSWIPITPAALSDNAASTSVDVAQLLQAQFGNGVLFAAPNGQATYVLQRSDIPIYLVDNNNSGQAGDVTSVRTVVGQGRLTQDLARGLFEAVAINNDSTGEHRIDINLTGGTKLAQGGYWDRLGVLDPYQFPTFSEFSLIDKDTRDVAASATTPDIYVEGQTLAFDAIRVDTIATGLPEVVGEILVTNTFVSLLWSSSPYGQIVGYYRVIVPTDVTVDAESFLDQEGRPQFARLTSQDQHGELVFVVYVDQQTFYPPCGICSNFNLYGTTGHQSGQIGFNFA